MNSFNSSSSRNDFESIKIQTSKSFSSRSNSNFNSKSNSKYVQLFTFLSILLINSTLNSNPISISISLSISIGLVSSHSKLYCTDAIIKNNQIAGCRGWPNPESRSVHIWGTNPSDKSLNPKMHETLPPGLLDQFRLSDITVRHTRNATTGLWPHESQMAHTVPGGKLIIIWSINKHGGQSQIQREPSKQPVDEMSKEPSLSVWESRKNMIAEFDYRAPVGKTGKGGTKCQSMPKPNGTPNDFLSQLTNQYYDVSRISLLLFCWTTITIPKDLQANKIHRFMYRWISPPNDCHFYDSFYVSLTKSQTDYTKIPNIKNDISIRDDSSSDKFRSVSNGSLEKKDQSSSESGLPFISVPLKYTSSTLNEISIQVKSGNKLIGSFKRQVYATKNGQIDIKVSIPALIDNTDLIAIASIGKSSSNPKFEATVGKYVKKIKSRNSNEKSKPNPIKQIQKKISVIANKIIDCTKVKAMEKIICLFKSNASNSSNRTNKGKPAPIKSEDDNNDKNNDKTLTATITKQSSIALPLINEPQDNLSDDEKKNFQSQSSQSSQPTNTDHPIDNNEIQQNSTIGNGNENENENGNGYGNGFVGSVPIVQTDNSSNHESNDDNTHSQSQSQTTYDESPNPESSFIPPIQSITLPLQPSQISYDSAFFASNPSTPLQSSRVSLNDYNDQQEYEYENDYENDTTTDTFMHQVPSLKIEELKNEFESDEQDHHLSDYDNESVSYDDDQIDDEEEDQLNQDEVSFDYEYHLET